MPQSVIRGDFPPNPVDKAGYRLEFQDEFDTDTLDTTKWLPYYLPQWSSRALATANYVCEPSELVLQITHDQQAWCPEWDGALKVSSLQTGVFAGAVGSSFGQHRFNQACVVREAQTNTQLYTPQYGYFEIRAKGNITPRNMIALWMIGYEDEPHKSGEILIFEIFGNAMTPTSAQVNYGVHPWGDASITDDIYKDQFPIDAAQYHIYALEWTPTHLDFYLDNQKIRTIHQSFHYPMQFMVNIYEFPPAPDADVPAESYPKTFTIDYIRGYQPINGY